MDGGVSHDGKKAVESSLWKVLKAPHLHRRRNLVYPPHVWRWNHGFFFPCFSRHFWPLQIPSSGRLVPAPAPFAFAWPWHPSDARRLEISTERELCWRFKGSCLETGYNGYNTWFLEMYCDFNGNSMGFMWFIAIELRFIGMYDMYDNLMGFISQHWIKICWEEMWFPVIDLFP